MKSMTYLAAGLLAAQFAMGAAFAQDITVNDAYVRASGVMAVTGAAFMRIENHGSTDDRLIGASTSAAKKAELHTHKQGSNGVMAMVEIEGGIALPAGADHLLKRGADHVMLMGLTAPLKDGDIVQLTLRFEQAGEITVAVPVDNERKPDAAMNMGHGKMGEGKMGQGASN